MERLSPAASRWRSAAAATLAALCLGSAAPAAGEPPKRVVSINLCTDQYALEFADPDQILALSPYAVDPAMSFHAGRAAPYPRVADSAEMVLTLGPDLVLASGFNNPSTLAFLRRRGVQVFTLSYAESFADIEREARAIALALGHPARGEEFAARLETARAKSGSEAQSAAPLSALYVERGGYVAGKNSLMDDLFRAAGVVNGATRLGANVSTRPLASASIEAILAARPDFLIVGDDGRQGSGEGAALLRHPALVKVYPPEMRVAWPVRETVCPGPSVLGALDRLAAGAAAVRASLSTLASTAQRCGDVTGCSNSSPPQSRP